MWRSATAGILLLSSIRPVAAIVNIEDLRVEEPAPGFSGQLAFAASGQSGNTDKSALSLGTRMQWYRRPATSFIVFNHERGETGGILDTKKSFFHARRIRHVTLESDWEAFGQVEENEFTRLSYRGLLGGGARLHLGGSGEAGFAVIAGLGAFYSREKLDDRAGATDAGTETLWRGNLYLVVKYRLNERVRVLSTTYYQPATNDFEDYRALEQAALQVKLTDRLDLKLSLDIAYDSRPPQLVEKTDTTYRTGIEYSF